MRLLKIVLRNFRNYTNTEIAFDHTMNILIGQNAQGKTNILEAIHLGALGKSHRTADDQDLIGWNQEAATIELFLSKHQVQHKLVIKLRRSGGREILANDNPIRSRELIGLLNAVIFSPEDLFLIKGTPAGRRRFLDGEISQASPVYFRQLLQYNRILLQRNQLLKKIRENRHDTGLLDPWDDQLAPAAAAIILKRLFSLRKLSMLANLMHRKITDNRENLAVLYEQNGYENKEVEGLSVNQLAAWFREQLLARRQEDIFRGSTGIGPQRDDLLFQVNGVDLRSYGSQGQQRTGILSLKLAEIEFIKSETGEYPILLLDDVLSELDNLRRQQLLNFIKDRIQTFITSTDAEQMSHKNGKYFKISNGQVTE